MSTWIVIKYGKTKNLEICAVSDIGYTMFSKYTGFGLSPFSRPLQLVTSFKWNHSNIFVTEHLWNDIRILD